MSKISFIIPSFNEEGNIHKIVELINKCIAENLNHYEFEIIFINDGSSDHTFEKIKEVANQYKNVFYIHFSRNFGQRNALKAGLLKCTGDCAISLDCDLQHPIELIPIIIKEWEKGNKMVYTLREEDKSLPFIKRITSKIFHKVISFLSDTNIEYGVSDFRLLDRKVVDVVANLKEKDIFWRGMVKWVGFKNTSVVYIPNKREAGETSYTFSGLVKLALTGIISFSVKPLYFAIYLGAAFTFLSLFYIPFIIYCAVTGIAVSGWSSMIMLIIFFGGLQLIILGIIGLYIGELFSEVKQRPGFIIDETNI
ncbi:MAG: glycosyltransferase family 2 protein [Bacteroidota bacterium]